MAEAKNNFLQGKMDKDLDPKLVQNGTYREAQNISILESESGQAGNVQPLLGNELAYSDELNLASDVDPIGFCLDKENDAVVWFVTNFDADDSGDIRTMLRASGSRTCKILYLKLDGISTPITLVSGSFLNLNKKKLITGVNILDGLLFWTDNYNQPRKINIQKALNDSTYYNSEDKISLAKNAPYLAPSLVEHQNLSTVTTDRTLPSNNLAIKSEYLKEKFVRFAYRYIYEDNEESIMSPFTQVVFKPLNNGVIDNVSTSIHSKQNIINQGVVNIMQNDLNDITLRIPLPYDDDFLTEGDDVQYLIPKNNVGTDIALSSSTAFYIQPNSTMYTGNYIVKGIDSSFLTQGISRLNVTFDISGLNQVGGSFVTWEGTAPTCLAGDSFAAVQQWRNKNGLRKIQVLIKESDDAAVRILSEINVSGSYPNEKISSFEDKVDVYPVKPASNGDVYWRYNYVFNYKSEKPYRAVPEEDIIRVNDIIPVRSRSQEVISNRIAFANFTENYNIPLDETGAKGINYIITSAAKGSIEVTPGPINTDFGTLQHLEKAYEFSSIKQNRTYQVGVVLMDKFGRESSVILSTNKSQNLVTDNTDTHTVAPDVVDRSTIGWSADETGVYGLSLQIDLKDSRIVPASETYSIDNPNGWYSWKLVVKQTEQEYYNVYLNHALDQGSTSDNSSWLLLKGDNINKVPRSINDEDINRQGVSGSDARLFPKVLHGSALAGQSKMATVLTDEPYLDVISIGTARDFGLYDDSVALSGTSDSPSYSGYFTNNVYGWVLEGQNNPLLCEIPNLQSLYINSNNILVANPILGLSVFETKPFDSKIDIYYETSTSGLVQDLNTSLGEAFAGPENIQWLSTGNDSIELPESSLGGVSIGTIQATAVLPATSILEYEVISFKNGQSVDLTNRISINSSTGVVSVSNTGGGFHFDNSIVDNHKLIVRISDNLSGYSYKELYVNITNSSPVVVVDSSYNAVIGSGYGIEVISNGFYTNGAFRVDKKFDDVSININFANITDVNTRLSLNSMFFVEILSSGLFKVKTSSQFTTYQELFNSQSAFNRTMSVNVVDNNGFGLLSTDTSTINLVAGRIPFQTVIGIGSEQSVRDAINIPGSQTTVWLEKGTAATLDSSGLTMNVNNVVYNEQFGGLTSGQVYLSYNNNTRIARIGDGNGSAGDGIIDDNFGYV